MARKTNKTSHVLNLITNGEPEIIPEQPEPAPAASTSTPASSAPAPAAQAVSAPAANESKVTVVNADKENSAVEEEIQKKLLEALEKEEREAQKKAEAAAKPEPTPVVEPEPVMEPEPVAELESEPVVEPEPVPVEEPVITPEPEPVAVPESVSVEEPVAAPEPEPIVEPVSVVEAVVEPDSIPVEEAVVEPESEPVKEPEPAEAPKPVSEVQQLVLPSEPEESYHMINVMEMILSRTDILKYMKEHGGCICSRCRADVYALVLTRLPSKYVVVDHSATNPMLSYYESKYRMRILTEIIKSCADVKENPRH